MGSNFTNDDLVREITLADDHEALIVDHPEDPVAFYEIELTPQEDTVSVWEKISITIRRKDLLARASDLF